jgi:hypothetical protein
MMPANHKVSVAWQVIFTFLPVVNFWAFYRVRKLRKYLLYIVIPLLVFSAIQASYDVIYPPRPFTQWGDDGLAFGYDPTGRLAILIARYVISAGLQALAIYIVIIWSRQHNKQFDQPTPSF